MQKKSEIVKKKKLAERERLAKALRENLKKRKTKLSSSRKRGSSAEGTSEAISHHSKKLLHGIFSWIPACAGMTFVLFTSPLYAAKDLSVTSWGGAYQDAQREIFFKPFTSTSEKTIDENFYDGGLDEIKALSKKETPEWDVVEVDAADLLKGCQDKYFEILNWQKIGQRADFLSQTHHNCGVGSVVWAMVLGYDDNAFKDKKPANWLDFWDVTTFPGKRALRKTAKITLEIALLASGVKPNQLYDNLRNPRGIDQAFKKLDELYPHIIWWDKGAQPQELISTKNVSMIAGYNGRIADAIDEGTDINIIWKDALYSSDYWAILKNSKNKDAAYQFLKFVSSPKHQVEMADTMAYAPTMKKAYTIMGKEKHENMPDIQTKGKIMIAVDNGFWAVMGEKLEKRFTDWLKGPHKTKDNKSGG